MGDASLWLGLLGCLPDIWAGQSTLSNLDASCRLLMLFLIRFVSRSATSPSERGSAAILGHPLAHPALALARIGNGERQLFLRRDAGLQLGMRDGLGGYPWSRASTTSRENND